MLVEAAWAAAKAPGPLHAFFVRIRARRGHQVAAVAVARKLAVLCWHLLTKETDYLWARPRWWPSRSGAWSSRPVSRPERGINAVRPIPTTSRHSEIGRCSSRPRPSGLTSTSSANGGREDQARECASASIRPGTNDQAV